MLTHKDLQAEFRAGYRAAPKDHLEALAMEHALTPSPYDPRYPRCPDFSVMREQDARALAYNAGLHLAIGERKAALTLWQNAVFLARP